ncbi:hypothetical protein ZIOFF_038633 [Zingiber officinale]|uniref:FH2 domain-containing protein n=1 Tax=Zingiber officinale TaxID=94328 RepID=A0A8J5G939_ZINOF|nr:hypothetical protein ZIOFF_038633 [Zingiber officinale]
MDGYVRIGETTTIKSMKFFDKAVISIFGDEYLRSPNCNDIARLLTVGEKRRFPSMLGSIDLPPPPPPPPPVGYWDSQVRKPQDTHQPVLAKSKSAEVMISSAMAYPIDPSGESEAMEKNQDTSRPKLKPSHWDKVQASSNRAMVWDQLKSSSFQ